MLVLFYTNIVEHNFVGRPIWLYAICL